MEERSILVHMTEDIDEDSGAKKILEELLLIATVGHLFGRDLLISCIGRG